MGNLNNQIRMSKTRNSNNENSSRRGNKRKVSEYSNLTNLGGYNNGAYGSIGSSGNSKKRGGINDLSRLEKMVPTYFPSDHPFNKDGFVSYSFESYIIIFEIII